MTKVATNQGLEDLKNDLLSMGQLVEKTIYKSVTSLLEQDLELAQEVIENDNRIDQLELEIQNKCMELLSSSDLTAQELKIVNNISKAINDLEVIGDYSLNIAKIAVMIEGQVLIKPMVDISQMTEIILKMLNYCLGSFVDLNSNQIEEISRLDQKIDECEIQFLRRILTYMMENSDNISQATYLIFVSECLEKMSDHTKNICKSW